MSDSMQTLPAAAIDALHRGRKVEAVRAVRAELGVDLKAARERVDAYICAEPTLRAKFAEMRARSVRKQALYIAMAIVVVAAGVAVAGYVGVNTFSHMGEQAASQMSPEEREWLGRLGSLDRRMGVDEVYEILGEPTSEVLVLAKWDGFAGSSLSQLRITFIDGHPRKIRWMKLGYFVYERNL